MKFIFLLLFLFFVSISFSQEKLSKEFSFISDNDLYISSQKDRYYSNGLFFSYRYLAPNFKKASKKIFEFQLGHQIYTPFKSTVINKKLHDRPFAGYLYGSFGIVRVFKNKTILKNSFQIGMVGKSAFGQELQEVVHKIYNFRNPDGWKYQIKNTIALNFDTEYHKTLGTNKSNNLDGNFKSKLRLGTIFNEATIGFLGRIGFKELQPIHNSIAFNTHLNNGNTPFVRGVESFLYYETSLAYVAYDATIQGSLFNNNSPITFKPNTIRFNAEIGYKFTAKKWVFGYAYHFHSNKLNNLRNNRGNDYGQLFFSYLFR